MKSGCRRRAAAAAMTSNAKLLLYIGAWYTLNVAYNDANKTVLKIVRLPYTMAALQLGLGLAFVVPMWLLGLRAAPKLTLSNVRSVLPVALIHGCGQCVTCLLYTSPSPRDQRGSRMPSSA